MHTFALCCETCRETNTLPLSAGWLLVPDDGPARLVCECQYCGAQLVHPIHEPYVTWLVSRGMVCERVETAVPSPHIGGPALTEDDLLAFGAALEQSADPALLAAYAR